MARRRISPFGRNSHPLQPFSLQERKNVNMGARDLFQTLNRYFWSHGLGYENGMSCNRKKYSLPFLSLTLSTLLDASCIIEFTYYFSTLIDSSINRKRSLAMTSVLFVNLLNRIFFYSRRANFKHFMRKLFEIYDKVGGSGTSLWKFRRLLIVILLANDSFSYVFQMYYLYVLISILPETYLQYGIVPFPYAGWSLSIILTLHNVAFSHTPVTAYFVSVCFILKELFAAFNESLRRSRGEDVESLFQLHCEISAVVSRLNHFLHPHLLLTLSTILILVFRDAYFILFSSEGGVIPSSVRFFNVLTTFLHFVCVCTSGSSVVRAGENVRATAQRLPAKFHQPRDLHMVSTMKESIGGFKIFNSIVIESSLILSAIGSLLSYGILIATFSSMDS